MSICLADRLPKFSFTVSSEALTIYELDPMSCLFVCNVCLYAISVGIYIQHLNGGNVTMKTSAMIFYEHNGSAWLLQIDSFQRSN